MGINRLEQGGYLFHGRAGWVSMSSREQQFTQLLDANMEPIPNSLTTALVGDSGAHNLCLLSPHDCRVVERELKIAGISSTGVYGIGAQFYGARHKCYNDAGDMQDNHIGFDDRFSFLISTHNASQKVINASAGLDPVHVLYSVHVQIRCRSSIQGKSSIRGSSSIRGYSSIRGFSSIWGSRTRVG